ncbi:MAG: hypothetical protein J6S73_09730 [Lentisphaeria bacterium]|nr:hypothetical protein [Lentisphaeria bacterium]
MKLDWFSDYRVRIGILIAIGLAGFGILGAKLYFEQVRRSDAYRERISRQMLRRIRIPGQRGKIFSADLQILADNCAGTSAVFYPEEMRRPGRNSRKRTIEYIKLASAAAADALGRPDPLTKLSIARHLNYYPGLPITVFSGLTTEEAAKILELTRLFDGIGIEPDNNRTYPLDKTASHIVGFAGRENPLSALDRKEYFYYVPDLIGRSGLEKAFDRTLPRSVQPDSDLRVLRGSAGFELVQVDSLGFIRNNKVEYAPPVNGNHLILTIDSRAQKLAERLLGSRRGAFVAVHAETGAVITMASTPGFSLNDCTPILKTDVYRKLLNDPAKPLLPRAYSGSYTPGSILKVLVAMALLGNGVDPDEKIECTGKAAVGNTAIRCTGIHGPLNLVEAIERSCNVYFIEQGIKLDADKIAPVLASAGVGESCGFILPHSAGTFPDKALKKRRTGVAWSAFDTALLSIGQGFVAITPLQAAMYAAAIANGGKLMKPYIVQSVVDSRGGMVWQEKPQVRTHLAVSQEHLEIVKQGMFQVVHSPQGSGRRAATPVVSISGKTGSAEVGPRSKRTKNVWFIAYAEIAGEMYAVAMVAEDGRAGGYDCAPAVAEFMENLADLRRNGS